MARFSLRQAAEQAGKSKSTIFRAIKSGRLSAAKTDDGGFAIEASELFRVYPPAKGFVARNVPPQRSVGHGATAAGQDATATETAIRLAELETELRVVRELLDEVKAKALDGLASAFESLFGGGSAKVAEHRPEPMPTPTKEGQEHSSERSQARLAPNRRSGC